MLDKAQSFNVLIARKAYQETVEEEEDEEDVIELGSDELINIIHCHIPKLNFDPDMARRGDDCCMYDSLPAR